MISEAELRPVLGRNIKRIRRERGMTQEDLAVKVGVTPVTINRIENGHNSPSCELLFSIADALEVAADDLRKISEPAEIPA